jgi:hypothetical protein
MLYRLGLFDFGLRYFGGSMFSCCVYDSFSWFFFINCISSVHSCFCWVYKYWKCGWQLLFLGGLFSLLFGFFVVPLLYGDSFSILVLLFVLVDVVGPVSLFFLLYCSDDGTCAETCSLT